MENCILADERMERSFKPGKQTDLEQYYSVDFLINGNSYQFKLWNIISMPMCILIKEDSDIISWLRVGEKLNMKYYSLDSGYPVEDVETEVRNITKNDQGRFRGHCFVALDISEKQDH